MHNKQHFLAAQCGKLMHKNKGQGKDYSGNVLGTAHIKKYALKKKKKTEENKRESYVYYLHQTARNFSDLFKRKHSPQ